MIQEAPSLEHSLNWLSTPVQYLKGVGPHLASLLAKLNIQSFEDYLYHLPTRYLDRRNITTLRELQPGKNQCVVGEVHSAGEVAIRRGKKVFEVLFTDGKGYLLGKWFRYSKAYFKQRFKVGAKFILFGEVSYYGREKQMLHPEVQPIQDFFEENELQQFLGFVPVYPSTEGLVQRRIRKNIKVLLDEAEKNLVDILPGSIREQYRLSALMESFRRIHQPKPEDRFAEAFLQRSPFHQRLVFCEFFYLQLGLALRQNENYRHLGFAHQDDEKLSKKLLERLPFDLTEAQQKAFAEIKYDMKLSRPMNRLLQGDVGSGKTIVALLAALLAIENRRQVALMAPTELLAEQHYRVFQQWLNELGVPVMLLTASINASQRKVILQKIQEGHAIILVGTHALLEQEVTFEKLSLVIIDEQHRFGVKQRMRLIQKAGYPDVLALTATPIPRSLAMTVYGDLEVSVIRELPKHRKPIQTRIMNEKDRPKLYDFIRKKIQEGRQAYFVFPLIEKSEKLDLRDATQAYEKLQSVFPEFSVALLHGRVKNNLKEEIMQSFALGKTQILVATTVIEVGIDVPKATIMVIEHAERFGLSQLHQLRGRVGRGSEKSYCILAPDYKKSDLARERLRVIESLSDGFQIAEEDLKLRGPGDFLGTRQSGLPDLRVANLVTDLDLLEKARQAVGKLLEADPKLEQAEHQNLKQVLNHRWKKRLGLAQIG